jgi:hypothetical protein
MMAFGSSPGRTQDSRVALDEGQNATARRHLTSPRAVDESRKGKASNRAVAQHLRYLAGPLENLGDL